MPAVRLGRDAFPTLLALECRAVPATYLTTTGLASSLNPSEPGQAVTFTSTTTATDASGKGGTPTPPPAGGKVEFLVAGVSVMSAFSDDTGRATYTTDDLEVGAADVRVRFYGGSTGFDFYQSSEATLTQTVAAPVLPATYPTTTTLVSSVNPAAAGQAVTLTSATTTPAAGGLPTGGAVEFFVGGASVAVVAADAAGRATYVPSLATGDTAVRVRYTGPAGFDTYTASEATLTQTVRAAVSPVSPAASPPPPPSMLAVGSDAGGTAKLLNADGSVKQAVNLPGGFAGAVRVAAGDLTGDGVADLIAAAGPGGEPRVAVYDGATGAVAGSFLAFEASFRGGLFVAAADFDADGKAELVVSPDEGGGPRVRVLSGADGGRSLADFFAIDDANFRGGVRATAADANGDKVPDLLAAAGFGGGPRVALFDGGSLLAGRQNRLVPDFFAFEETLRNGAYVGLGDLDGDGYADLVLGAGPGGGPRVLGVSAYKLLSGSSLAGGLLFDQFLGDPNSRSGVRVSVGDQSGAGLGYVVATPGGGGSATAVTGRDGSPLTGLKLPGGGAVAASAQKPAGGSSGVPGTSSWKPADDWKQVGSSFTPPAISNTTVPAGTKPTTPDFKGTYTAQFTGGVKATKVSDGSAASYNGTIDVAATLKAQEDTASGLRITLDVRFSGSLKAGDGSTLPLDLTFPAVVELPGVIDGDRKQFGAATGSYPGAGGTLNLGRVSLRGGVTGFPNFLTLDFRFEGVSGGYVVQKTGTTTGYLRTAEAAADPKPGAKTGTFTVNYTATGREYAFTGTARQLVDWSGESAALYRGDAAKRDQFLAKYGTGRTRDFSGTVRLTVDRVGPGKKDSPAGTYSDGTPYPAYTATEAAGSVSVTGTLDGLWSGGPEAFQSLDRGTYYERAGVSTLTGAEVLSVNSTTQSGAVLSVRWDGSTWVLAGLLGSKSDTTSNADGTITVRFWYDEPAKTAFTRV